MTDQAAKQDKDAILFASKASQLIQEQKIEEALNMCETGVRTFPFYSPGHYTLGLCYEALGKEEDAKNEFERTLVYDPSHNKAMRKLSEFYRKSGLDQLANELLVKEALYSPLDPEIINIVKENDLYSLLNPEVDSVSEESTESISDVQIENEMTIEDEGIQSIEEIDETEQSTSETETEMSSTEDQTDITEESTDEDESDTIDNLDPLAGSDDEEMIIDNDQGTVYDEEFADSNDDLPDEDDFSPLMQGYLEKDDDDEDDEDQWMEVENLLDGEEEISETDLDPVPEGPKGETDMLLEQLSNDEDDDIDLEAGVVDPYDQIDLTSEVDRKNINADELSGDDLSAGVEDPFEKKEEPIVKEEQSQEQEIEEVEGDTISEIVSEFENEENRLEEDDSDLAVDENLETADNLDEKDQEKEVTNEADNDIDFESRSFAHSEDSQEITPESDEEVTIRDMLENPNLVTPTFGEILIAQHKFSEARHVFVELSKKEPDNTRFIKKIQFLDKFLQAE